MIVSFKAQDERECKAKYGSEGNWVDIEFPKYKKVAEEWVARISDVLLKYEIGPTGCGFLYVVFYFDPKKLSAKQMYAKGEEYIMYMLRNYPWEFKMYGELSDEHYSKRYYL